MKNGKQKKKKIPTSRLAFLGVIGGQETLLPYTQVNSFLIIDGFKAADKVKLARRMEEAQMKMAQLPSELPSQTTTIQFGLSTHKVFKTFTLFCHGLFAGFAFWHIVMVFTLIDSTTTDAFLEYYYRLAQPVQSLYFILFVLCTVSVFDRWVRLRLSVHRVPTQVLKGS